MNRLENTIKDNVWRDLESRHFMQSKHLFRHTYTLLQSLTAVNSTAVPLAQNHRQHQQGNIPRHTRPTNKSSGHRAHVLMRETIVEPQLCLQQQHYVGSSLQKLQPLEAVPRRLLENLQWQCILTHNEAGPLTHLPNPVFFSFESEEK